MVINDNTMVIVLFLATFIVWFMFWHLQLFPVWLPASEKNSNVSLTFFILPIVLTALFFENRDTSALVDSGLSRQNAIQLGMLGLAALWSFWLTYSRKISAKILVLGPIFWLSALLMVYLLTTLWSVWGIYTALRSIELIIYLVIGIHLFSNNNWYKELHRLLFLLLVAHLIAVILINFRVGIFQIFFVIGGLRSNTGGLIASAYLLILCHAALFFKHKVAAWRFLGTLSLVFLFGSLTSIVAGMVAMLLLLALWARGGYQYLLGGLWTLSLVFLGYVLLDSPDRVISDWLEPVADIAGKTPEHIVTLTGRLPLWTAIFEVTLNKPFGQGFAAADRLFGVILAPSNAGNWQATHAHSGFMSAWMGAGWLGLILVILLFVAVLLRSLKVPQGLSPIIQSMLLLLFINNFTIMGVGGQFNPAWVIMMALCCVPPAISLQEGALMVLKEKQSVMT